MHQQCLFLSVEYPYSQFRHLAQIVTCTGTDHSLPNVCNFITKNQRHLCKLVAPKTNIRSPVFWDCRWGKLLQELGHPRRMPLYTFFFFLPGIMNQIQLSSTFKTKGTEVNGLPLITSTCHWRSWPQHYKHKPMHPPHYWNWHWSSRQASCSAITAAVLSLTKIEEEM